MPNGNSKRRTKINYNTFYNSTLKNNRYLERHPEAKWSSYTPVFAGVGQTSTVPRTTLAPTFSSLPVQTELEKYYVVEQTTTIDLAAQSYEEILNEAENGEILAIEAVTSSPLVTVEIVVYGMGNSPNIINDYSINEMIRLGRGLTPGDVEVLPGGRAKDTTGIPRRYYPYVARYKHDILVDHLGESREVYVFVYEPAIPMPYSSIIINVKNNSTESNKTVDSVNIHRRVLDPPGMENLVGTPIESAELFRQPIVPKEPTIPVPPNTSPYYANYLQRQKELAEQANAPELLPDEQF